MAKKKSGAVKVAKPARKSPSLTIRATPEWRDWLERASDHCRTNASGLIDVAVAEYVKNHGFTEHPPKR